MPDPSLLHPLQTLQRQLQLRLRGWQCAVCLVWLGAAFCLLAWWERAFQLTELQALLSIAAVSIVSTLALTFLGQRARRALRNLQTLALDIEQAHPELLDSFICAVELEQQNRPLTSLEESLRQQMRRRMAAEPDFFLSVFTARYRWRRTLVLAGIGLLLLIIASLGAMLPKASFALRDLLAGECSGIVVYLPADEVAIHSDLRLEVKITRWEQEAEIEVLEQLPQGRQRYRQTMLPQKSGRLAYNFYDLNAPLAFRILTPSLRSSWQTIDVYTPPAPEAITLTTLPLPYTRREAETFSAFQDFTLIEGEAFRLQLQLPPGVSCELQAEPPFPEPQPGPEQTITVTKTTRYQAVLRDQDGHSAACPPFTVTAEPDLPPVLEIREPGQESTLKPGDALLLDILARDDFGLLDLVLQFSLSGADRQARLLYAAPEEQPAEKEIEVSQRWDFAGMNLQDGDLLTCVLLLRDNRQPAPQTTRSDLFFITVRPDSDSIDSDGDSGQEKKADISDLLAEAKRLLRFSWDILSIATLIPPAELQQQQFTLLRDLKELELEVRRRFNQMQTEAKGMIAEPLPSLFATAGQQYLAAIALAERQLIEESLQPQERALTALVRIENEMLKNSMKSKKAGQEGEGESAEQEQPQHSDDQQQSQLQRQALQQMQEALDDLRLLAARQEQLNRDSAAASALPAALAERQDNLMADSESLRQRLAELPEARSCSASLTAAGQEMRRGTAALQRSDLRTGAIHGQRAHNHLLESLRNLENALRTASANQIARLSEQAAGLAEQQRQESENSASLPDHPNAAQEARERQRQLREQTGQLRQEVAETSALLENDFPEVAQSLRRALEQVEQRGLQKSQTRAQNALLYKRFEAAAKEQRDAANLLQSFAQDLSDSASKLPPVSSEDLRQMLEQLQRHAEEMQSAGQQSSQERARERMQQVRDSASRLLQNAAEVLQDPRLQQISDSLQVPIGESPSSEVTQHTQSLFRAASEVLLQYLARYDLQNRQKFSRQNIPPPKKYKRQVQEYFKELGTGE
jgi:hypothetical protein